MRCIFASLYLFAFIFVTPAYAVMEDYPSVKLQGLDKSVGRTVTFEAKVGDTIQYGPLFVKVNACRKAPPIETPESAAFLQIWEIPPGAQKSEWVFSGWMFASSPALSAMDNPVYDVWVLECTGREDPFEKVPEDDVATDNQSEEKSTLIETPVDSEAQDQTTQTDPVVEDDTQAVESQSDMPSTTTLDPDAPKPIISNMPTPEEDAGFTAYDLMRQQKIGQ